MYRSFFFSNHCIKQIDSMLRWVCLVIDHRGRQNDRGKHGKNNELAHEPQASVTLIESIC